jgi:hypothetical protein
MYEVSPMCPKAHTYFRAHSIEQRIPVDTLVDTSTESAAHPGCLWSRTPNRTC